ncbi:MAG TPA: hypothetical protein VF753_07450 [Terriglobales bacterium]
MSSKATTGLAAAGIFMMFIALCMLPEAFRDKSDSNTLVMAACMFGAGAMITGLGMYLKAGALKGSILPASAAAAAEAAPKKKLRGGCDLCGTEMPVVLCTVHQVHMCGSCQMHHYDQRSCAYVPSKRGMKAEKNLAKAKGA